MKVWRTNYTFLAERRIEAAYLACRNIVKDMPEATEKRELHERIGDIFKNKHFGLLEHASATFHVEGISRSCTHQLVRHRISSYAQLSMRQVEPERLSTICPSSIGLREDTRNLYVTAFDICRKVYKQLRELGVPKEDARFIIPMGIETQIVITMNFRSWIHFLKLRTSKKAQWEIRAMANEIWKQLKEIAPNVFNEKYQEYWE